MKISDSLSTYSLWKIGKKVEKWEELTKEQLEDIKLQIKNSKDSWLAHNIEVKEWSKLEALLKWVTEGGEIHNTEPDAVVEETDAVVDKIIAVMRDTDLVEGWIYSNPDTLKKEKRPNFRVNNKRSKSHKESLDAQLEVKSNSLNNMSPEEVEAEAKRLGINIEDSKVTAMWADEANKSNKTTVIIPEIKKDEVKLSWWWTLKIGWWFS